MDFRLYLELGLLFYHLDFIIFESNNFHTVEREILVFIHRGINRFSSNDLFPVSLYAYLQINGYF